MGTSHKHAACIKAWAEGAEIEGLVQIGADTREWRLALHPCWYPHAEYRVKPKPIPDKVWYTVATPGGELIPTRRAWANEMKRGEAFIIKTTIKTADNGSIGVTAEVVI